jgi:hypothetical protein
LLAVFDVIPKILNTLGIRYEFYLTIKAFQFHAGDQIQRERTHLKVVAQIHDGKWRRNGDYFFRLCLKM